MFTEARLRLIILLLDCFHAYESEAKIDNSFTWLFPCLWKRDKGCEFFYLTVLIFMEARLSLWMLLFDCFRAHRSKAKIECFYLSVFMLKKMILRFWMLSFCFVFSIPMHSDFIHANTTRLRVMCNFFVYNFRISP